MSSVTHHFPGLALSFAFFPPFWVRFETQQCCSLHKQTSLEYINNYSHPFHTYSSISQCTVAAISISKCFLKWRLDFFLCPLLELIPKLRSADKRGLVIAVPRGKVCVLLGELCGLHANCCKGRCHHDLLLGRWPSPANREAEAPASPLVCHPLAAVLSAAQTRQGALRRG